MHNLLIFLQKYNYWFLFVFLELIGGFMLFHFNSYQGSVWFTQANEMAIQVVRLRNDATNYLKLGVNNRDLTDRNIVLQQQVALLRDELIRRGNDSLTLDHLLRNVQGSYKYVMATVVSNSITKHNNYLVIDKGEAQGVKPEMGVVSGTGVVGIVYLTNTHYSLVIPVINLKSNISCRVRGSRVFGYLQWNGDNPLVAYVNDIPRYARIKVGDCIETSGYSSVFPAGIFVGRVVHISNSTDGMAYSLKVNLSTDFANLRDVSVVINQDKPEIDSLRVNAMETEQIKQ
ncbi:MAG: rod shape-determining protein MreC [Bacteroidaceae bacterium]